MRNRPATQTVLLMLVLPLTVSCGHADLEASQGMSGSRRENQLQLLRDRYASRDPLPEIVLGPQLVKQCVQFRQSGSDVVAETSSYMEECIVEVRSGDEGAGSRQAIADCNERICVEFVERLNMGFPESRRLAGRCQTWAIESARSMFPDDHPVFAECRDWLGEELYASLQSAGSDMQNSCLNALCNYAWQSFFLPVE